MDLYWSVRPDLSGYYGSPEPAPGARVFFVYERWLETHLLAGHSEPLETDMVGFHVFTRARETSYWPCRLFRVRDLDVYNRWPDIHGWYCCRMMTLVEELPSWHALGPHGERVAEVLEQAQALTSEQVARIAAMDGTAERRLHARGQPRDVGHSGAYLGRAIHAAADRSGDKVRRWDSGFQVHVLGHRGWQEALQAGHAMLWATAAPEAYNVREREILARRWTAVLGAHT
ncbi:hypothetical protein UK23_28485 [Lentzea aerocolonigenes]|uniref:Uncharacterized protein n=1 Tax=Lentzea aerocolonigenes TaxID=68170 RepID=A0A0F0GN08_LENAE|nr:hypothetical protein [Lentzea aerocolonigenes]KJK44715.1 hypothetical protein UK23_28485 [Lentzea aerocolonigenes]